MIINLWGYPLELNTYAHILGVLGVGGYRDQQLGEAGVVEYGDRHFTCFQFDYDSHRDIVEITLRLISPIRWKQVLFLFSDHLEITKNPAFMDNLLHFLLESQHNG